MNNHRKSVIESFAKTYSDEYRTTKGLVDLAAIAKSEDIDVIFDHYKKSFEGLTVYENERFYIHIDLDSTYDKNSGRTRFTLAHELGHGLIDEHRLGLITGELKPHVSFYLLGVDNKEIELEADYFASCLLMPSEDFKREAKSFSKTFSIDTIRHLANYFKVSILATVLRFVGAGTESVFVTFTQSGCIRWFKRSDDFPKWAFKFKVGEKPPENTVVGDYFLDKEEKYTTVEEVDPEAWFYVNNGINADLSMFEQCIYVEDYDYVISILWFS